MLSALLALAMLHQISAAPPPAPVPAVAERLALATSLPDNQLFTSVEMNLPAARRKALETAMVESRADVPGLRHALATAYARHLTPTEMEAAADFFESAVGASLEQKVLKGQTDHLSAEEMQAARAFAQTPAGRVFRAKEKLIGEDMIPVFKAFGQKLMNRAQEIHCRDTKECGPFIR